MIKATQITEKEARYRTSGIDAMGTNKTHRAKGFIPLNATDMALVTECGLRLVAFTLASKYDIKHEGHCPVCT